MVNSILIDQLWVTANSVVYIHTLVQSEFTSNITSYPVELAVTSGMMTPPKSTDWVAGSWSGEYARVKIGPIASGGLIALEEGSEYFLWARVTTADEKPEIPCGSFYTYGGE